MRERRRMGWKRGGGGTGRGRGRGGVVRGSPIVCLSDGS